MSTMMREASISFPMLGDWAISPSSSYEIFGHTFYWYGAILALGFLLALLYCSYRAPRFGLTADNLYDLVLWILPFSIVGARLYYVACEWASYKDNLIDIFKIWEGGLAIYGSIIAGAVVIVIWSRKKNIPAGATLDLVCLGVLIGQLVGRWANFINREAFGEETDIFCRMGLTPPGGETVYVHPTFLYESLWNLAGFIILSRWAVKKSRRRYDGHAFILYVLWYGIGRMLIEGLRTDSLYISGTGIRTSQLLAALSALAAVILLVVNSRRQHPELFVNLAKEPAKEPADSAADK